MEWFDGVGVGVDIEVIARFEKILQDTSSTFITSVFTPAEQAYCFQQAAPAQHFAVRFAAKEAIIKALSQLFEGVVPPPYRSIEIVRIPERAPNIRISMDTIPSLRAKISLSHAGDNAVAFALVTASVDVTSL